MAITSITSTNLSHELAHFNDLTLNSYIIMVIDSITPQYNSPLLDSVIH